MSLYRHRVAGGIVAQRFRGEASDICQVVEGEADGVVAGKHLRIPHTRLRSHYRLLDETAPVPEPQGRKA